MDRPILFSGPMVRALLDGRKTQTRRVIKDAPAGDGWHMDRVGPTGWQWTADGGAPSMPYRRRFGVGDRLWVRETIACGACAPEKPSLWAPSFWRREQGTRANPNGLWYAADDLNPEKQIAPRGRWVPGIHMPRWASRLTLTVTDVRVQRLQEVSEEDAAAEGWPHGATGGKGVPLAEAYPIGWYATLWDGLNAKRGFGWSANPWVVALTFTVEHRNIDAEAR